jgi:predicted Zn-ribbon and HTH transcriptional regulator
LCSLREGACAVTQSEAEASTGLEVADIFRRFSGELSALSLEQAKAIQDIVACRTPTLGGHVHQCDHCGYKQDLYNSCCNRHCPKCQSLSQVRWIEERRKDLLPVEYFHIVFTISSALHPLFRFNTRACYNLLFAAVSETLQEVALNPALLGAKIGFTAVLHTWTQTMLFHPHIHCIVPGGGLNSEGTKWLSCKSGFFLPVKILSTVFRGKLLSKLERALSKGEAGLSERDPYALLREAASKPWVVYCKAPFAGPDKVLRYLGRYTHRIAISNNRLISMQGRHVTFRYKDRTDGDKQKLITVDAAEFTRRFLMHVLPHGFMRIRHFGFLSNASRKESIPLIRRLLAAQNETDCIVEDDLVPETWQQLMKRLTGVDMTLCPACKTGHLIKKEAIQPSRWSLPGRAASP